MQRVALFVDVQNIYYTVRDIHHCHFDYRAFFAAATAGREVVKALAYAIDRGDARQIKFQQALRHIGFEVKLKPYIQRRDGSSKGDWDVGITMDMMDCARDMDTAVLASGDGDFAILADRLRRVDHVSVEVYGVRARTAAALIEAASAFVPIEGDLLLPTS